MPRCVKEALSDEKSIDGAKVMLTTILDAILIIAHKIVTMASADDF